MTRVFLFAQKPVGGVAVLPSGGLFGNKKKDDKDKENRDSNIDQNGTENESQLNSSAENEKTPKDKKERSKVRFCIDRGKTRKMAHLS